MIEVRIASKKRFEGACVDNRSIRYSLSEAIAQVKTSACPRVSVVDTVLQRCFVRGTLPNNL